jgi:peptidoglycan-N-acetylglucosamine deacetylase
VRSRLAALAGAGVGLALGAHLVPSVAVVGQWAPLRTAGGVRWRGSGPAVSLTFDDGPNPDTTPPVLDELDRLGVRATFFCVGRLVDEHPRLAQEIAEHGHELATHGYEHVSHLIRGPGWVRRDLAASVGALDDLGLRPRWFRPPYGHVTGSGLAAAGALGLSTTLWSAWGREWREPRPGAVAELLVSQLEPGAILLLHDNDAFGRTGMAATVLDALAVVVGAARERGLEPVTLDDLVGVR